MKKIDSLLNQVEELQLVQYRIRAEGLHYCFKHYSSFEEIGDEKFHELRKKYLTISDELESYISEKIDNLESEISSLDDDVSGFII